MSISTESLTFINYFGGLIYSCTGPLASRALVIAFRKACLLYVANGMKWERSIESFCRWSLFYDLYIKMAIFGDLIRHADDDMPTSKPSRKTVPPR